MSNETKRVALPLNRSGVLITGGTSGVGLATAIGFARAGARVVINGRDAGRGADARGKALAAVPGADIHFVAGDCNSVEGAASVCGAAEAALGGAVDILVNSTVGPYGPKLFHNIALSDVPDIVAKQMMAPLLTSRAVWDGMRRKGGGAIINIASDAGKVTTPGETVIGAAMAGIIMFSRTLATEGKRDGIRVNCVTPSIIEGTATYAQVMSDEFAGKLFGKAIKMAQLGVVNAEDMAGLIVFLGSPAAAKLSGQAISLNGGISQA